MENNNIENVETETTKQENVETNAEKTERTFTQDEVNSIIAKEKARAKKNIPSDDELAEFNKWKDSQKTNEDKLAEKEQANQKLVSEKQNLYYENLTLKKGVNIDDIDYVIYKVSKMDGEFEDNLNDFINNNPKFTKNEIGKATGVISKGSTFEQDDGVLSILKSKHPELND